MVKIRKNLKVAQDRKESYADKRRTNRKFKVGEYVFLKVKSKRISLKLGSFPKLETRSFWPFEILEKIGTIAYMLALPACMLALPTSMKIHNVFHVSLLKNYVPDPEGC
jgi:hypothetical protein